MYIAINLYRFYNIHLIYIQMMDVILGSVEVLRLQQMLLNGSICMTKALEMRQIYCQAVNKTRGTE